MKKILTILLTIASINSYAQDVVRERPKEWEGIVEGGRFQDLFLPMQGNILTSDTWGADEVLPRYIDNGMEDDVFSYWGGNIIKEEDKYHLFVCGWLENSPKGHMTWPQSVIMHTVSDKLDGPYNNIGIIAFGHNPELYKAKNDEYIISAHTGWKPYIYHTRNINGVWKQEPLKYDARGREIIEGMSNLSFTTREDGSVMMVCRGGGIWVSRDGLSEFKQITTQSVYPKREGRFEDPVIWRDNIQYHMIVNDWLGRIAYYLRSADGVNWIEDVGEAYTPDIAFHNDGEKESWYKFERIKIFQDEHKRAIQANFAVCDTLKKSDLGNDHHSSKNIMIPLNKGVLMSIVQSRLTPKMKTISIRVEAEDGFNPIQDLDIKSLRFGLSSDVNFGKGCKVKSIESDGEDLIITFKTNGYTIPDSEFAPKLLGRNTKGGIVYGYTRNPNVDFEAAILSCCNPEVKNSILNVTVENFGLKTSLPSLLRVTTEEGKTYEKAIPASKPYERQVICLEGVMQADGENVFEIVSQNGQAVISREILN